MLKAARAALLPVLRTQQLRAASTASGRSTLEALVAAVKNPELIPTKALSKFAWLDQDRRKVEEVKAWEASCTPLTQADRPVVPLNKYLYNIKLGDEDAVSPAVRTVLSLQTGNSAQRVLAEKRAAMAAWARRPGDSGSTEVQVAILTVRINNLHRHFKKHTKDKHTRRGLEALTVQRRKLLQYMKRVDFPMYRRIVLTLGLQPVRDSKKPKLAR
eukprot:TRINITY_DN6809_c0_g1_i2.p1 TRINITY_DN6809_c0_g1~~TRINITY_DN6809_c0_g1_i2.p1  ORF type:complete len:215 (-),score=85.25 TRINITY_DN6809_c0_g1_i2:425-1069(-)